MTILVSHKSFPKGFYKLCSNVIFWQLLILFLNLRIFFASHPIIRQYSTSKLQHGKILSILKKQLAGLHVPN